MRSVLKWIGVVFAGLIGLVLVVLIAVYLVTEWRMNRSYQIEVEVLSIAEDSEAIERGARLAVIRGCLDCHGENLAGQVMMDDPMAGRLVAGNLTAGRGGISGYSDTDWVRAVRHGLDPDGKPLVVMPSHEFYYLSDADLADTIAYVKSAPPVDNELPGIRVAPLMRAMYLVTGDIPLLPAELIDHEAPRPVVPKPGVNVAYGRYLAIGCLGCHGEDLAGGPMPGRPPDWPEATNLTPGGELHHWSLEEFITTMRTGVSPHGHALNNEYMPWKTVGKMTDEELEAVFLYLLSVPPVWTGEAHED